MGDVICYQAVSADGYSAGPDQSDEEPLGVGGEELHGWMLELRSWREAHGKEGGESGPSELIPKEMGSRPGALVMGRKMFGGGPGPWNEDEPWTGWWGDDPPYHVPVFVVTHHAREPVEMRGGTTFHFVTDGVEAAIERAREAAGDDDVLIAGGASVIQQGIAAGLVDEVNVSISPLLLGGGERLFDNLGPSVKLEQTRVIEDAGVTHVRYRVGRT